MKCELSFFWTQSHGYYCKYSCWQLLHYVVGRGLLPSLTSFAIVWLHLVKVWGFKSVISHKTKEHLSVALSLTDTLIWGQTYLPPEPLERILLILVGLGQAMQRMLLGY